MSRDESGSRSGSSEPADSSMDSLVEGAPETERSSVSSAATKTERIGNDNRNVSPRGNVSPASRQRLVPVKGIRRVQKVEEKIVEERKSVRTGSPRRRKATLLHFMSIFGREDIARVRLLLSNISDRPLQFKLKCEPGPDIAALPSAKGRINKHSSAKCTLTWRRDEKAKNWTDAQQPKMLLILDFLGDKTQNEKRTSIRLIGKVTSGHECDPDKPPVEQLMLDAASERMPSKSKESAEKYTSIPKEEREQTITERSKSEGLVESVADWLSRQSKDTLLGLLLLILFFYFLGATNSKRRRDE